MSRFLRIGGLIAAMLPWMSTPAADLLTIGGGAYHFDRNRHLNEFNPGLGYEHDVDERWSWAVGGYKNSIRRASFYLLANYYVLEPGAGFRLGVVGGAITGYRHWSVAPVLAPTLEWRGSGVATQIYVVPTVRNLIYGGIFIQVKFVIGN